MKAIITVALIGLSAVVTANVQHPTCPSDTGNAVFPNFNDCTSYYTCSNGFLPWVKWLILQFCPLGLQFDWKHLTCTYPHLAHCEAASTPEIILKSITTTIKPSTTTTLKPATPELVMPCPSNSENTVYPNSKDCETYLKCINGELQLIKCSSGLFYDWKLLTCTYPDIANCDAITSVTPQPSTTPKSTTSLKPNITPKGTTTPKTTTTPKQTTSPELTRTPKSTTTPKENITPEPTILPKPTTTSKPITTPKPLTTPKIITTPKPITTPEQMMTPKQNATTKPTTTPKPTITPKASTNPELKTTPKPTITPIPTTTSKPTTIPEQTTTPKPTTTPKRTTNPEPTTTPNPTTMLNATNPLDCPPAGYKENILLPNPDNCHNFYQCVHGVPKLHNCPVGLFWNDVQKVCDYKCVRQYL